MKNMKKFTKNMILFCTAATLMFIMAPVPAARASMLPGELGYWRLVSEHVTGLTSFGPEVSRSTYQGKWLSASYVRPAPPAGIEVQLMEGPGLGTLFVPEGMVYSNDGPIGFLSTYETLSIAGRRAILELSDVTGQALAVALGTQTVTFEARGVSREELLGFAESMIETLQGER